MPFPLFLDWACQHCCSVNKDMPIWKRVYMLIYAGTLNRIQPFKRGGMFRKYLLLIWQQIHLCRCDKFGTNGVQTAFLLPFTNNTLVKGNKFSFFSLIFSSPVSWSLPQVPTVCPKVSSSVQIFGIPPQDAQILPQFLPQLHGSAMSRPRPNLPHFF